MMKLHLFYILSFSVLAYCEINIFGQISTRTKTNAMESLIIGAGTEKAGISLNASNKAKPRHWRKPCIVDWKDGRIWFGGIQTRQIGSFCVWSMDDSELLWFLQPKRRDDYTRKSRTNSVIIAYGEPPVELKQLYPKSHTPRIIKENEIINAHFTWTFMSMVGRSSDQQFYYFRKVGDEFISVPFEDIKSMGYDLDKTAELQRRMYFLVMTGREYPAELGPEE